MNRDGGEPVERLVQRTDRRLITWALTGLSLTIGVQTLLALGGWVR